MHFVTLLKAALTAGRAHVADRRGKVPDDAAVWGWQHRIVWVAGIDLFLDPGASYQVACDLASSERLVGEQTLRHRLRESGLLASVDTGRQMVQVRRTLEGRPRQVLHLKIRDLRVEMKTGEDPAGQEHKTSHSNPRVVCGSR